MATLGASMVTLLTDNWAGAGATPTFGFLIDYEKDLADTTEQVLVRLPIHEDVNPINDIYSNFKFTVQLRVKTTVDEDRLKVLTDETIRIINSYAITGITRQFAKRGENTSDRKRQVFSYDVWAVLEEHMSTGGTSYSSPGAGDVAFPANVTIAGTLGVTGWTTVNAFTANTSIDGNPITSLGATTVTGNATVTGNIGVAGTIHDGVDEFTIAQLADLLMFGSANAAWVPCTMVGGSQNAHWGVNTASIINLSATDLYYWFQLPLSSTKGALKLYVSGIRVGITDADVDDYISQILIKGDVYDGNTTILLDNTNYDSAQRVENTFAAHDCSGYDAVHATLLTFVTDATDLDITFVTMRCYYAA